MCPITSLVGTQIHWVSHQWTRQQDQLTPILTDVSSNKWELQWCAAVINTWCQNATFRGVKPWQVELWLQDLVSKKDNSEWFHTASDFTTAAEELLSELVCCSGRLYQKLTSRYFPAPSCPSLSESSSSSQKDGRLFCPSGKWRQCLFSMFVFHTSCGRRTNWHLIKRVNGWLKPNVILNKNKLGAAQWESSSFIQQALRPKSNQNTPWTTSSLYDCMYNCCCRERCDQNKQFSLGEEMGQRTMRAIYTISWWAACTNYTLL